MLNTSANITWIKRLFNDSTLTIVFHNAKFDLKMFAQEGVDIYNAKARIECTLIISKLYNGMLPSHKLAFLGDRLLGRSTADKFEIIDWLRKENTKAKVKNRGFKLGFDDAPIESVKKRVYWDVETTLLLWFAIRQRVVKASPELLETELMLMYVCIEMEDHGVQVDITRAKELRTEAQRDIELMQRILDRLVLPIKVKKKRKGEEIEVEISDRFNPNSRLQMEAAFNKVGIPLKYKTKPKKGKKGGAKTGGGNWSFDEYAIIRYVSKPLASIIRDSSEEGWSGRKFYNAVHAVRRNHKLNRRELLPPLVLYCRRLLKMVSTYYDHIINEATNVHVTSSGREIGILHCRFNQSEAMTGRFSSSSPNLQNVPRVFGPRECFIPRNGRRNWHFDYEQVEMKMFVHFAKDEIMARAIADDIHLAVAAEIYNKPKREVTKEQRKRAKAVNFGIIYGSGPGTQAETLTRKGLPTTKREASKLVASYHRSFPSVRRTTNKLKAILAEKGFVTNPFGRRYHIRLSRAYTALNYMCQGTSADQIKVAMVTIWKELKERKLRSKIIKTIHDEIVLEIPRNEENIVPQLVLDIMEDYDSFFVPITADVEVNGSHWGNKEKAKKYGFMRAA